LGRHQLTRGEVFNVSEQELTLALEDVLASVGAGFDDFEEEVETAARSVTW
jgi:hypothetical protein